MPDEAKILEISPYPAPEQELGVSEDDSIVLTPMERRYKIGHLEAGQRVSFLIVTDGGARPPGTTYTHTARTAM